MSSQLSKNFNPADVEDKWTDYWDQKRYFHSTPDERKPFTVVIPPPNVTGVLHMGHTLNETVQDVLVRRARMTGYNACWVPGSDHASIATEAKVVQMLEKEKGILKQNLSREDFLTHAFEWKEKYGGIIYQQIKKLGCSVDWERVTFTMDSHYYAAVVKVFVDLFNKGLIYRGARMINWDPQAQTALSDEEVEHRDVQGKLYYVQYEIVGKQDQNLGEALGFITVATQRPETIMGDVAVCVNPNDERYKHLQGANVRVPLVNREVPVIFDEYVDPAFGTGALKITPAHDINDYNIGLKHNLPLIDTLNADGTISDAGEIFVGMDRFAARKAAVEQLRADGLLIKEEDYQTRLGFSQRTNAVVEPRISTQWFVKMKALAGEALNAVLSGDVKIHPEERFLATYKYWLENVKDWCISRQLWWGQRIPAWYDEAGRFVVAENETDARMAYQKAFLQEPVSLSQDEDVLDTWFSSWLWPMEVFEGITQPDNKDFNYYYPTSVLVTGQDIIFFWVARMIMAGEEFTGKRPFEHVYFTGMVRDKQGRKMSKQLGNSPDLLKLINDFGADAVRFGILISAPAGNDLLFDESSCEQGKHFNNKIWNALKLVMMLADRQNVSTESSPGFAVDWFRNRLHEAKAQIDELYKGFRLSEALKTIYSLIWDDYCSWYLEWIKPAPEQGISTQVYQHTVEFLEELMELLHPFMPFITEEVYHRLREKPEALCVQQIQSTSAVNMMLSKQGELLQQSITAIRDARIKNSIKSIYPIQLAVQSNSESFASFAGILKKQVNADALTSVTEAVANAITIVVGDSRIYVTTEVEVDNSAQRQSLQADLERYKSFLLSVDKKLNNKGFVENAKADLIALERKKKSDTEQKIKALEESLAGL